MMMTMMKMMMNLENKNKRIPAPPNTKHGGAKANFLKQFFNAWGTRSDTARAPKIGCYKNGRPFLGLGAVSKNP